MNKAIMWSKADCPYCIKAEALLREHGFSIEKHVIGFNATKAELLEEIPHARTVPQIFFVREDGGKTYIGGYDQLQSLIDKNTSI